MHISTNYNTSSRKNINNINILENNEQSNAENKNILFEKGTSLNGEVIDLKRNEITLKLSDGNTIKGKIENFDNIEIGYKGSFTIDYNEAGQLFIEVNSNKTQDIKNDIIIQTLKSLGFKASDENINMINILIKNQFPINKEILQKFNQALKLMGAENIDKAIFFMQNNIKIGIKNSEQFNKYLNHEIKIDNQITNLISDILKFAPKSEANNILNVLINKNFTNDNNIKADSIYKELNNIINEEYSLNNSSNVKDNSVSQIKNNNLTEKQIKVLFGNENSNELNINNLKSINDSNSNDNFENFINTNKDFLTKKAVEFIKNASLDNIIFSMKELGWNKNIDISKTYEIIFGNENKISEKINNIISLKDNYINKIINEIAFKFKDSSIFDLEKYINTLGEKTEEIKKSISQNKSEGINQILKDISEINKNLEFMSYNKNNIFIQIPLNINNKNTTAELYIFKDKKNKKSNYNYASVLISLDLNTLGHFEAYIQKNENSISFQFRIENKNVEKLINENINILENNLKKYNYTIQHISFKQINEAFTILNKEPNIENDTFSEKEIKKIRFDIRT